MSEFYAPYLNIRQIPSGRAVFALRGVRKLLGDVRPGESEDLTRLREAVRLGITNNNEAFLKRQRFEEQKRAGKARGQAEALDPLINEAVSSLRDLMLGKARGNPDKDEAEMAQQVLDIGFIGGVAPITQVHFEIQVSTVRDFLGKFAPGDPEAEEEERRKDGPLLHVVEPLKLTPRLTYIDELNDSFEIELQKDAPALTQAQVDLAFQKGQQALHEVFVGIFWIYRGDSAELIAERTRLAAPIVNQDTRVGELNRRSRRITDVNPETGVEEGAEPAEPTTPTDG